MKLTAADIADYPAPLTAAESEMLSRLGVPATALKGTSMTDRGGRRMSSELVVQVPLDARLVWELDEYATEQGSSARAVVAEAIAFYMDLRRVTPRTVLPKRWPRGGVVLAGAAYEEILTPRMREIETCAAQHPWRPETTRWRKRDRGGRHGTAIERDCLICKWVSSGERQRRTGRRYL